MNLIKMFKDIEKLCMIEAFIMDNGRALTYEDFKEITTVSTLERIMEDYTYGWDICMDGLCDQLISINEFKNHILKLMQNG